MCSTLKPLFTEVPAQLIEKIWPECRICMGLCVCKWLQTELSKLEATWAVRMETVKRQSTLLVAMLGHVGHGKSSVVRALSGKRRAWFLTRGDWSMPNPEEQYTNVKVYRRVSAAGDLNCGQHNFRAFGSASTLDEENRVVLRTSDGADVVLAGRGANDKTVDSGEWQLVRHICLFEGNAPSLVPAMARMQVDAALVVVAVNEPYPQPQVSQPLAAAAASEVPRMIILQSKTDLVFPCDATEHFHSIRSKTVGTAVEDAAVIPISAHFGCNLDIVAEHLARLPALSSHKSYAFDAPPLLSIVGSHNPNKPNCSRDHLKGGFLTGVMAGGLLNVGTDIEIRPGLTRRAPDGTVTCVPLLTRVTWLRCERRKLSRAGPGALVHVGTQLDPTITTNRRLAGQVAGRPGALPPVSASVQIQYRLVFSSTHGRGHAPEPAEPHEGEELVLMVGPRAAGAGASTGGTVRAVTASGADGDEGRVTLSVVQPMCVALGDRAVVARRNPARHCWGCIALGKVCGGRTLDGQVWPLALAEENETVGTDRAS